MKTAGFRYGKLVNTSARLVGPVELQSVSKGRLGPQNRRIRAILALVGRFFLSVRRALGGLLPWSDRHTRGGHRAPFQRTHPLANVERGGVHPFDKLRTGFAW